MATPQEQSSPVHPSSPDPAPVADSGREQSHNHTDQDPKAMEVDTNSPSGALAQVPAASDPTVQSPTPNPEEDADESVSPLTAHKTLSNTSRRTSDPSKIRKPRGGSGRGSRGGRKPATPRKHGSAMVMNTAMGKVLRAGHMWIHEVPDGSTGGAGTEDETASVASSGFVRHGRSPRAGGAGSDTDMGSKSREIGTAIGTRRQANGTIGSVYSGNKIRHIKKEDGTALWRKDIQHRFLELVVDDEMPCFTRKSDGQKNLPFVDIYVDAMARSSKTSKILKDRLHSDREAAKNMAMICLLVNVGRMNTTLNFFPEMRAQLRTYHSIPSLQAYKSQRDYKSLQDAPRLKSILKGASEDDADEPKSLDALKERAVPRTNPVNLIFLLSHYAPKVSETHFPGSVDFFDLVIRHTISSASRAKAFLWLMWWYLESNFTKEDALNNPFGAGTFESPGEEEQKPSEDDIPLKVPLLEMITEEEGNAENVDPRFEQEFAERMAKERKRIVLEYGDNPDNKLLQRVRKSGAFGDDEQWTSDADSVVAGTASAQPKRLSALARPSPGPAHGSDAVSVSGDRHLTPLGRVDSFEEEKPWLVVNEGRSTASTRGRRGGRGGGRGGKEGHRTSSSGRVLTKSARAQALDRGTPDTVGTPQPSGTGHAVMSHYSTGRGRRDSDAKNAADTSLGAGGKVDGRRRPRPLTQHQRALEHHRRERVEYALAMKKKKMFEEFGTVREEGNWVLRAARRIGDMDVLWDSEEEEAGSSWGMGGLMRKLGEPRTRKESEDDSAHDDSEKENGHDYGGGEEDDFGEEVESWVRVFSRAKRRLDKWGGDRDLRAYEKSLAPPVPADSAEAADGVDDTGAGAPGSDAGMDGQPSPPPEVATTTTTKRGAGARSGRGSGRARGSGGRRGLSGAKRRGGGRHSETTPRRKPPPAARLAESEEEEDEQGLDAEIERRLLAEGPDPDQDGSDSHSEDHDMADVDDDGEEPGGGDGRDGMSEADEDEGPRSVEDSDMDMD